MALQKLYRKPGKKYKTELRPSRIDILILPLVVCFLLSIVVWSYVTGHNRPETETEPPVSTLKINGTDISEYTIIHNGSKSAIACANELKAAITKAVGCRLPVKSHTAKEGEREILVGKTNRAESAEVRGSYSRPNVYYDVKVIGTKLVIMGEGRSIL